ncbi:hypothetical protein [Halonatronum saccharophilum]|uniref:hypothetical protein n=1 Tax=Halonatronum saccharophilum TaxID=150060 RepID=UPI000484A8BE|nr:hypothetical protein [Halonatronum saccharophilum]
MDEIENTQTDEVLVTSLLLLKNMKIYYKQKEKAKRILMDKIIDNEIQEGIKSHLINALTRLNINSKDIVEKVVNIFRTSDNQSIRSSLYTFLYSSNYLDKNIKVFLEGIANIKDKRNDSNSSILINEGMNLRKGIEKVETVEGLIKILDYFINNPRDIVETYIEDHLKSIAKNCVNAYSNNLSIFNKILNLFVTLVINYSNNEAKQLIVFFEETRTKFKAFKDVFEQRTDDISHFNALALLVEKDFFDYFVTKYKEGAIAKNEVWFFQNSLDVGLYKDFNNFINEQTDDSFKIKSARNNEKKREERMKKDIKLLFDKDKFIAEIRKIFDISGKDVLNSDYIWGIYHENYKNSYILKNLVIESSKIVGEEGISLEKAIKKINSLNWDSYCIRQVYDYLSKGTSLPLTDEQEDYIKNWCYSNINKINFKTALNQNGKYSFNENAIYLWFFLRKFNLQYSKNILLDMLSFDCYEGNGFLGIEYLEEYLDNEDISERVLDNLKNGIDADIVLRNHIDFCERYSIKEVIPYAINSVIDDKIDNTTRKSALKTICKLSDDSYDLEEMIFEVKDEFKWTMIHEVLNFIKKSEIEDNYYYEELKDSLKNRLRDIFKSEDEEIKIKAAQYLIKLGDLESLKYYVEWVDEYGEIPKDPRRYDDPYCLLYLEDSNAVPELMKLLELSFKYKFIDNRPNILNSRIEETLIKIALLVEENYNLVKESVGEFISSYSSTYEKVTNLHYFLDNLEEKYLLNKSEEALNIESVIDKMQKWGFINLVFNNQDNVTNINVKGDNNRIAGRDHKENETNIY